MFSIDVSLEGYSLFLKSFSGNIADIAVVLLVVSKGFIYFSELSKRVKHNTGDDAAEKNTKEDSIDHVIGKSYKLELFHRLTNSTRYK